MTQKMCVKAGVPFLPSIMLRGGTNSNAHLQFLLGVSYMLMECQELKNIYLHVAYDLLKYKQIAEIQTF